jgi:hypothetical protein
MVNMLGELTQASNFARIPTRSNLLTVNMFSEPTRSNLLTVNMFSELTQASKLAAVPIHSNFLPFMIGYMATTTHRTMNIGILGNFVLEIMKEWKMVWHSLTAIPADDSIPTINMVPCVPCMRPSRTLKPGLIPSSMTNG